MARFRLPSFVTRSGAWAAQHSGWLSNVVLSLLLAALGWYAMHGFELRWARLAADHPHQLARSMFVLERVSFDVPFVVLDKLPRALRDATGQERSTGEVVLVYMDDSSAGQLRQPTNRPWSRTIHAKLLDRLTQEGARAVFFDAVFDSEMPEDTVFAEALARNGHTMLGAKFDAKTDDPLTVEEAQQFRENGLASEQLTWPNKALRKAARGWGLLTFRPVDSDYGVRRLYAGKPREEGLDPWPTATWRLAQMLGAELPEDPASRFSRRWVNYYGPLDSFGNLSYYRVIVPASGVDAGFFRNKVVFIGGRSQLGSSGQRLLDEFGTPWSRLSEQKYTPGVEIQATIFLNLLHHDWLERLPFSTEQWFVVVFGLALGALRWLRPWRAGFVALIAALAIFGTACLLQWQAHLWWNWATPVLLQTPVAVILAVGSRYYLEERGKRKLRSAFGFYLSPDLASEIAERDFTLAPGGEKVLATMVFTDLEGFTTLSEKLGDSARLGEELTRYFTRTTDEILAEKGTVIKFIGDAVFAAWGAPLPQADQAERAVRAAWKLAQVSEMDVAIPQEDGTTATVHVRTRIGIHTGEALAGNLGSARRFDYTLIGDAVNFAARLEGANKYTGTTILISDDTAQRLNGKFLLRRLGAFKVKGKGRFVVIHELLGDDPAARPSWLGTFEGALAAWFNGDFPAARTGFEAVKAARGGKDGPSQFYLDRVDDAIMAPGWTGEVELEGK